MRKIIPILCVACLAQLVMAQGVFETPESDGNLLRSSSAAKFKTDHATVTTEAGGFRFNYQAGDGYPRVEFPLSQKGWNLSAYGGVQIQVKNLGKSTCRVGLRVDNEGRWQDSPWNTALTSLAPGEETALKLSFGESGFPLNAAKVVGMQLFVISPKEDTSLWVGSLKAVGSSKDRVKTELFSTAADRDKAVTPATWVGRRPPVAGNWVQTLNQGFDGDRLDAKVWSHETWWNGLLEAQDQAYSPSMTTVQNGRLTIRFEKRTIHQNDDPKLPTRPYATGYICSFNKWTQRYGYIEARIKVPTARGLWPAFWMMPDRGPSAGPEGWKREDTHVDGMEVDIMEILTEWGRGQNNVAVHWNGYDKDHKTWGSQNTFFGPTSDEFHAFGLLWEPGKLTWYIDGIPKASLESQRVGSTPCYLILNIQSGNWATKNVDLSKLPDKMEVDYVRAWQRKERLR